MHDYFNVKTAVDRSEKLSSTQKLLYTLIMNLSRLRGFCFASNGYFAKRLGLSAHTVSRQICVLKQKKFVSAESVTDERNFSHRILIPLFFCDEDVHGECTKADTPVYEDVHTPLDNNIIREKRREESNGERNDFFETDFNDTAINGVGKEIKVDDEFSFTDEDFKFDDDEPESDVDFEFESDEAEPEKVPHRKSITLSASFYEFVESFRKKKSTEETYRQKKKTNPFVIRQRHYTEEEYEAIMNDFMDAEF